MNKIFAGLKKIGLDSFLLLIFCMIILAYFFPSYGVGESTFSLKNLANFGVSVIFFFYGLRLSPDKLKAGLSNWKLPIVIHVATFLVFPLIILPLKGLFVGEQNQTLWLGIFFLATLPSTVSSSVVMVSIAKGNIPAAILNASLSGLIGVFIMPLWMSLILSGQGDAPDLTSVIVKLLIQVIVPVGLGCILNRFWGDFAEKHKKSLRKSDQAIILLIIYTAFCESFIENAFDGFGFWKLLFCSLGMVALFFVVYLLISLSSKWLKFNREDKITALFCGSKKSLVHGTVMSKVLFANSGVIGIILLPTMLYHALQIIIVSIIARKMGEEIAD